jgi:hypothetical protein
LEWRRRLKHIDAAVAKVLAHPDKHAPPPVLTLGLRLRTWQTLPHVGGLLDQPEALMQQIDAALAAYDAWQVHLERRQAAFNTIEAAHV